MKYLFFFLLTCPIWAQQYTTEYLKMTGWQQLHLKGKVKSLKITSYEAETTDNKQLKALRLAEEEPIVQYLFDSEGKLTQREVYTAENTLSYTSHYSYNDAGRLALIRTPNIFGATDTTREETFEYGAHNELLSYKDTYNGQVLEKRNYEYPAKGQQLTVYYTGGDFPFDRITYTYSAHRLTKEQRCEGSNCYRHDRQGDKKRECGLQLLVPLHLPIQCPRRLHKRESRRCPWRKQLHTLHLHLRFTKEHPRKANTQHQRP